MRRPDATVIDATGKYVFPGFIDPHVHIYLPFMGTFAKDDYETATQGRAGRRHDDADRDGAARLARGCASDDGFEIWMSAGGGQGGVRLHIPHGRVDATTRRRRRSSARS